MKTPRNVFYAHGFGKAAPWVDLANSEEWDGFGKRTDQLNDPKWLAAFLKHWKLAPISPGKSSRLALVNLRDVLRRAAQMRTAAGFFTIPQRPERSGGAMTGLAATGQGCAGRGQRKNEAPDNEIT